jgi:hypothetical protein
LLLDGNNDSAALPLLEVTGGQGSTTQGIEITGQSYSTAGTAPSFSWVTEGLGGLSLVQMGEYNITSGGQPSPFFSMCANQNGTSGQGPACWSWQVQGGNTGVTNPPDILQLFRETSTNTTSNITVLFPAAINLATAPLLNSSGMTVSAGQITVGPQPYTGASANVLATFTGASTSYSPGAAAGPVVIQPGQLTNSAPDSTSTEGALQVMQSYLGTNNIGLLACQDTTAPQGVVVCGSAGTTAAQIIGVYDSNPAQAGASITPIRYGRASIKNSGSTAQWVAGHYVCRDTTNNGYVVDNGTTPCNRGTYVGMSVGDTTTSNSHTVDLVQEPIVQGGAVMTFFCGGAITPGATQYMFPSALFTSCAQASSAAGIQPISFSGTLKNLEVLYATGTGGTGTSHTDTFTVAKCPTLAGCTNTSITCNIVGTSSPATCSDPTHTASVSEGDGIQITDVAGSSSGAANPRIMIELQ